MPTVTRDRADDVERVAAQAREALPADGGEDRVDQPVEPRDLVRGPGAPGLDEVGGRLRGVARGGVGEEVDVGAHHRQRRPELVGDHREQLRAGRVELAQPVELLLGLGLEAPLLHDPRQQGRDRQQELDLVRVELPRLGRLRVEHADHGVVPDEGHGQHRVEVGDVEAADPAEPRIGGDVGRGHRRSLGRRPAGDALADGEAHAADLRRVEAVGRRQREPLARPVEQVERAHLDAHRDRRPVDQGPHQLVPVARLGRQLGELVEERELAEAIGRPPAMREPAGRDGRAGIARG